MINIATGTLLLLIPVHTLVWIWADSYDFFTGLKGMATHIIIFGSLALLGAIQEKMNKEKGEQK